MCSNRDAATEPMLGALAGRQQAYYTCALLNNFVSVSCRSCCSLETPVSASPACCCGLRYVEPPVACRIGQVLTTPDVSFREKLLTPGRARSEALMRVL